MAFRAGPRISICAIKWKRHDSPCAHSHLSLARSPFVRRQAITAPWIGGIQLSVRDRAAFPRIATRSNGPLLSFSFMKTISPGARSGLFVPRCPQVPDLFEIQDRQFAFSDDCRALALLGGQYHRSHD